MACPVKRWLRERGYWVARGDPDDGGGGPLTHVFLDGGRARVPPGEPASRLLDVYAECCASSGVHLVERAHGTYRMFADLDVPPAALEGTTTLEGLVARALLGAPKELASPCAVCLRHPRAPGDKGGAHVVWADVPVDDATLCPAEESNVLQELQARVAAAERASDASAAAHPSACPL